MSGGRSQLAAAALLYALYVGARRRALRRAITSADRLGPQWLGTATCAVLEALSGLIGVRQASDVKMAPLDAGRPHIVVWHPHGFIAWSATFVLPKYANRGWPAGVQWQAGIAPALFMIPVISELLMICNGRPCDRATLRSYLDRGWSIGLTPGGVREQLGTRADQEQAFFPAGLGFIRLALQYGRDLVPCYVFNENQMFDRVEGLDWAAAALRRLTGLGVPIVRGKFGIPQLLLPKRTDVHVRWGVPIVVERDPSPSDERVEELFQTYMGHLRDLFDAFAYECLPPEVAARGLKITRMDGGRVPPQGPLVAPLRPTGPNRHGVLEPKVAPAMSRL